MEIIELIGSLVARLIMLIMLPFMGLVSLIFLNLFSWLYVSIIGILFAVQIIIPKNIRIITVAALSLGIITMWISLFASYQGLPYNYIDFSNPAAAALGGFPITAFEYPPAALGSNEPPFDTWGLFYLNLGFWFVVGSSVAIILRKYLNNQILFKLFGVSVIISLYGIGYLFAQFD
ncbi:MAG: hypothetical protein V1732_04925 [Patescibacteria group bacterium]|nr:hypothetical protein [Patescibacteria group bacterium]MBU4141337.1 hypothetical protein [Patescibacteria group bacterium]